MLVGLLMMSLRDANNEPARIITKNTFTSWKKKNLVKTCLSMSDFEYWPVNETRIRKMRGTRAKKMMTTRVGRKPLIKPVTTGLASAIVLSHPSPEIFPRALMLVRAATKVMGMAQKKARATEKAVTPTFRRKRLVLPTTPNPAQLTSRGSGAGAGIHELGVEESTPAAAITADWFRLKVKKAVCCQGRSSSRGSFSSTLWRSNISLLILSLSYV
mmetsp:Transcript_9709/g.15895  ORF Transcript_9709/g.15895 Transcript_9709/m.15895 type:complete len:215 (+) Transcript_9709:1621-2265(+)